MGKSIIFLDHTIDSIISKRDSQEPRSDVIGHILKYPVQYIDLKLMHIHSLEDIKGLDKNTIRVEFSLLKKEISKFLSIYSGFIHNVILSFSCKRELEMLDNTIKKLIELDLNIYIKWTGISNVRRDILEWLSRTIIANDLGGFIFSDRYSLLDPFQTEKTLLKVKERLPCEIEFCPGNGYGLATANTLAALQCGINKIHSVVGGASLMEGASMEEVIVLCKYYGLADNCSNTKELAVDCMTILRELNLSLPVDKAIIGSGVFAHESGIHVDGVLKNPGLYELFQPEEVGLERRIVIGKHSGRAAIRLKLEELGLHLEHDDLERVLLGAKQLSQLQKSEVSSQQLLGIYNTIFKQFAFYEVC